ncbi:hypothetical protein FE782_03665 [Paenibacillus antri]|uniref:Uncharacterized protein n=1 Tax=Paenibacillus antri TaxID=2582848 RepID=A0A5R9GE31_9BACL|nr:hypothetical protein [Paenibacillus antri]TLS53379.1 hypothetical protein FE782_03665 [Paenibacillus antri]
MITKRQAIDMVGSYFHDVQSVEAADQAMKDSYRWLKDNYDQMDDDAKKYVDDMTENLLNGVLEKLKVSPDSPNIRKTYRDILTSKGEHVSAPHLLRSLENPFDEKNEFISLSQQMISDTIQYAADFLLDIGERRSASENKYVVLSLFYHCIDELLAALHLAKHHYYLQANAHLRTVLETLDKVELFTKFPEKINIWKSGTHYDKNKHLSPSSIRKQLGKPNFDPIYGFLSEHGTHMTFQAFQARTGILRETNGKVPTFKIFVGGTRYEHLQLWGFTGIIIVANLFLSKVCKLGDGVLNEVEALDALKDISERALQFVTTHLIEWAKTNSLDTQELDNFLKSMDIEKLFEG